MIKSHPCSRRYVWMSSASFFADIGTVEVFWGDQGGYKEEGE